MKRFLACTAVGLFIGLTPAFAETDSLEKDTQVPPAAMEQQDPAQPSEAVPLDPAEPGAPIPGQSSEIAPGSEPGASIPDQSSEMAPGSEPGATSPDQSSETAPDLAPADASPPSQSSEAPKPLSPAPSASLSGSPEFLNKQDSSDWLASSLIGKSVVNAENETIGDINDLVTDQAGKVVAVLIGAGGFLGIGEKDVAVRFEDLKLARDESNNVTAMVNISQDRLAAAPDYETLAEQQVSLGAKSDREDIAQ